MLASFVKKLSVKLQLICRQRRQTLRSGRNQGFVPPSCCAQLSKKGTSSLERNVVSASLAEHCSLIDTSCRFCVLGWLSLFSLSTPLPPFQAGLTALILAAYRGKTDVATLLLEVLNLKFNTLKRLPT